MEEDKNTSGSSPQASSQPHWKPRDTSVWLDKYNSTLMGGSVLSPSIGISLPSQNVHKKEPNKRNWYQEMMDEIQNKNPNHPLLKIISFP